MDARVLLERPGDDSRAVYNVAGGATGKDVSISLDTPNLAPRPRQPSQPPTRIQARPAPPPPPAIHCDDDDLQTFANYANPGKLRPPNRQYPPLQRPQSDSESDGGQEGEGGDAYSDEADGDSGGGNVENGEPSAGDFGGFDQDSPEEVIRPSEGYRSLDEEKADILFKLSRLRKQGVRGFREFTTYSDIRDMRTELARVRTELEVDRSIKFSRKVLMVIVSALEFANNRWDPFDLELDGWSETVHEGIDEYDGVFEELYFKYRGKVPMPPEVRLILMLGGSAFMFHMQHAVVKKMLPNIGDALRENPNMIQQMMSAFAPAFQQQKPSQPAPPAGVAPAAAQPAAQEGRREMRGPGSGFDLGALLNGAGGLGPLAGMLPRMPPGGMPLPDMTRGPTQGPTQGPREVQHSPTPRPEPPRDATEDERFSDVISEDLQSVNEEDLQSVSSSGSEKKRRHVISLGANKRRRGPARKTASDKDERRVVII
jgi:hypothetical protein